MTYPTEITANMTFHEVFGPAMSIESQEDADAYFEILVTSHMRVHGTTRSETESEIRESLGYWSGYYDVPTRERVERLFRCEHPVLGPIATAKDLTAKEIFEIGIRLGRERESP